MRNGNSPFLLAILGVALTARAAHAQPAPRIEVTEATVADLQRAMTTGKASSVDITKAYLARIAAYDHAGPQLNAIIRVNPRALQEAAARDAERKAGKVRGPLHGIPVLMKDNFDTGDMPTTAGSLALANSQPARDAEVVRRVREAGAVLIAKANMHELAAGITSVSAFGGQTRNPYDLTRCPGGSSGGTGAAVAASYAAIGWGSDTCGSIRIPSAFGSLFGLRPSTGVVSRSGVVPLSHTQDTGGPLTRSVADLAIAMDLTAGYDSADAATQPMQSRTMRFQAALDVNALKGARIGVFTPYFRDTDAEIADTVRAAIEVMKQRGATVVDVAVADFDSLIVRTSANEFKYDFINYMKTVPNAPVKSLREILDRGLYDKFQEPRYVAADTVSGPDTPDHQDVLARQAVLRARIEAIFDSLQLDAMVYPTIRQRPVLIGEAQPGSTCQVAAQSGLPAISMPAGFLQDGLPVGIELLGRRFTDVRLVALASSYEAAAPRRRAPTTTPALVAGRAPRPTVKTLTVTDAGTVVQARVELDAVRNELRWQARVVAGAPNVSALVFRRRGGRVFTSVATAKVPAQRIVVPDSAQRVVARLLGPEMRTASGTLTLTYADRSALAAGTFTLALYTARNRQTEIAVR
mgnify:CR=1 FL=1